MSECVVCFVFFLLFSAATCLRFDPIDPKQVTTVHNVKSVGATGLALLGKGNSKELELEAADAATRDVWVSGGVATRKWSGGGGRDIREK